MEKPATDIVASFMNPANRRSTELYQSSKLFKDTEASIMTVFQLILARVFTPHLKAINLSL